MKIGDKMKNYNCVICSLKKEIAKYSFYLQRLEDIKIEIRLFQYMNDDDNNDNIYFETSHFIHTPLQFDKYTTSINSAATEELALDRALSTIIDFYNSAISEGYEPNKNWLVPNSCYND